VKRATVRFGRGFKVAVGNRRSQAATMTLEPGDSEGGPDNCHHGADQWLFVASGTGLAVVNGSRVRLRAGSLLLMEHGDRHGIRNTGTTPLKEDSRHEGGPARRESTEDPLSEPSSPLFDSTSAVSASAVTLASFASPLGYAALVGAIALATATIRWTSSRRPVMPPQGPDAFSAVQLNLN
jgi:mannose-6-phosphate isomerase-like protein (cupin superfamily)